MLDKGVHKLRSIGAQERERDSIFCTLLRAAAPSFQLRTVGMGMGLPTTATSSVRSHMNRFMTDTSIPSSHTLAVSAGTDDVFIYGLGSGRCQASHRAHGPTRTPR